jgi:hypothetical protein
MKTHKLKKCYSPKDYICNVNNEGKCELPTYCVYQDKVIKVLVYAITGSVHGSLIESNTKRNAINAFKKKYPNEPIWSIHIVTNPQNL